MIAGLRIALAVVLIPVGALAAFFICYAALYPTFWAASVTLAGRVFQLGTLVLALAMAALLWRKPLLQRHLWAAALLLTFSLIVIAYVGVITFTTLGSF
jgi:hypothetical protein